MRIPGSKFSLRDWAIDYDTRQIFIQQEEVRLTQTEYSIVALLAPSTGKMVTYSAIIKPSGGSAAQEGASRSAQ